MNIALAILSPLAGFFIFLLILSPGKPEKIKDAEGNTLPNSLSEKTFIQIGGVRQGMFIRSADISNPVLLFLHGGPGFPNYFLFDKYKPGLEDFFTVCYWEQRGGGLSYSKSVSPESMNLSQLASDAIEVTNYLRKRFRKDKIYIMAWSGGTTIALPAVDASPHLFHAYITMGQLTNQPASERIAFEYITKQLEASGDRKGLKQLEKFNNLNDHKSLAEFYNSGIRDHLMHKLGIGTMREMRSVITGIFLPVWACKAYTLKEKYNLWKSKIFFLPSTTLKTQTLEINFAEAYPSLQIPIFFVCGKYDLTVNADLTKDYYLQLKAPFKRFYLFEHSAHAPLFEERDKFREIIKNDILPFATSASI